MRCATWAHEQGGGEAFARAVFERQFVEGEDIADLELLLECARGADLDAEALSAALEQPAVKDSLREATDRAWEAGVRGVPTVRVGESVFYGDDQLELVADALARR
jgi:predicted DsbA family dithiol-disulfide isomerase